MRSAQRQVRNEENDGTQKAQSVGTGDAAEPQMQNAKFKMQNEGREA